MRIDLLLATPSVAARAKGSVIDRNARKERDSGKPSDHVPVILEVG
jgi:exonuclease III